MIVIQLYKLSVIETFSIDKQNSIIFVTKKADFDEVEISWKLKVKEYAPTFLSFFYTITIDFDFPSRKWLHFPFFFSRTKCRLFHIKIYVDANFPSFSMLVRQSYHNQRLSSHFVLNLLKQRFLNLNLLQWHCPVLLKTSKWRTELNYRQQWGTENIINLHSSYKNQIIT